VAVALAISGASVSRVHAADYGLGYVVLIEVGT